jgi:alpha-beta hydrolase superfamily lysophospholipase
VSRKRASTHLPDAANPLLIGGAVLLALDVGRRIFRRSQLFEPEREPVISWNPEDYGIAGEHTEVLNFETDDGELLYGWYCRANNPIGSALYCHGNTGNLSNTAHVMPHLLDAGINVLLFDYRGFGRSSGSPSLSGIIDDGVTAARLHEKIRPKNIPSILYGYSLGGAIAAQIIRRHPFDGLVLQSTFTNLPDIARVTFPRLPLHLISGRFFDTMEVVRNVSVPVLIMHGTTDEVCPSWMAQQLHDSCGASEKKLILVDGGLHKDLFERAEAERLVWEINRFAASLRCTPHVVQYKPGPAELILDHALRFVRRQWRRHLVQQPL